MQDSGGAVSLTKAVVKLVGRDKAIFASVLCGGVLAYGGISGFVIIFWGFVHNRGWTSPP